MPVVRKVFAKLDTPIPLGYSLAGTVVDAGRGRRRFGRRPGRLRRRRDRQPCRISMRCPKNLLVRIPDGVSDEEASFVTLGAIALQGVRVANPTLGERIVVTGLGLIGLLTVQLLKANGCRVLGFDPNPAARRAGAGARRRSGGERGAARRPLRASPAATAPTR